MGRYIILGESIASDVSPDNYRGIYRSHAYPHLSIQENERMMELCIKYLDIAGANSAWDNGVKLEDFSMNDLKILADFHKRYINPQFEIIYYDYVESCPNGMEFIGIDIAGEGGHSIIGGGFFVNNSEPEDNNHYYISKGLSQYFLSKLNKYGLFFEREVVDICLGILKEWEFLFPGWLEKLSWRKFYLYIMK